MKVMTIKGLREAESQSQDLGPAHLSAIDVNSNAQVMAASLSPKEVVQEILATFEENYEQKL